MEQIKTLDKKTSNAVSILLESDILTPQQKKEFIKINKIEGF